MPSEANRTPGPWRVKNRGSTHDWDVVGPDDADMSGMLRGMVFREEDARLIAAAPELLEAAKDALDAFVIDSEWALDQERYALDDLRAAIAKAEGRDA